MAFTAGISGLAGGTGGSLEAPFPSRAEGRHDPGGFAEALAAALREVNAQQVQAAQLAESLVTQPAPDLLQVTLATERAKLSLDLAIQVRNKLVEAYQEISRMPI